MATFYLDFEGGNDANNGTSFANRWKTLESGATAARIAPGDTIRIKASRDAISLGNGTWTDNSLTVTLASAKNATIWNGDAAFTGVAANITGSTSTSNPQRKIGTTRCNALPAGAFTTGKMAYFTLPSTLDLSSYQQISFWFSGLANCGYSIKLCSDATGDTPVDTLTFTCGPNSALWQRVVVDKGSALGSAIASISIHATSDPGTTAVSIQNLIACTGPDDANCLTHLSLIGKNSGTELEYHPLLTIDGTTIKLGGCYYSGLAASGSFVVPRNYRGTTETVTTYAINPERMTSAGVITDSGSSAGQITYSGGWNRTDMSTQTGETFVSAQDVWEAIYSSSRHGITMEKVNPSHGASTGFNFITSSSSTSAYPWILTAKQSVGNAGGGLAIAASSRSHPYKATVDYLIRNYTGLQNYGRFASDVFRCKKISHNDGGYGMQLDVYPYPMIVSVDECKNNLTWGLQAQDLSIRNPTSYIQVSGCTFDQNGSGDVYAAQYVTERTLLLDSCTLNSGTKVYTADMLATPRSRVCAHRYGNSDTDHRQWLAGGTIVTETSVRHTASGIAWKISPTESTVINSTRPIELTLAQVAVVGGSLVTMKCWVRRTNTGLTAGIKVAGYSIIGVTADVTATMTAAADTWEELTITFTPTVACVVELLGFCYGGTTYSCYFDDLTITQA